MRTIFRFFFSIYGFLVFLALMLLLLPLFIFSFLRGEVKGGNILFKICRFWADVFFWLIAIRHKNIYEAEHDRYKQYIFISNHISYLDIPMMMKAVRRQHIRILGKAEMAKIPIFGFIYKQGAVLVNRKSTNHRMKSVKDLVYFLNKKISVFICPEGTFNVTHQPLKSFYDGAFRIAIETQMPIRPILFLDTYDRLNYKNIFSLNPGICRAVYLPEIKTSGLTLRDI
ncbi:MAG: lysophospholipid acyltransferase family protein, partial [Ginsengibacter sp.]